MLNAAKGFQKVNIGQHEEFFQWRGSFDSEKFEAEKATKAMRVSGAIKRQGGTSPFREVRRYGAIPLGGAVLTSAGRLPFKETKALMVEELGKLDVPMTVKIVVFRGAMG